MFAANLSSTQLTFICSWEQEVFGSNSSSFTFDDILMQCFLVFYIYYISKVEGGFKLLESIVNSLVQRNT